MYSDSLKDDAGGNQNKFNLLMFVAMYKSNEYDTSHSGWNKCLHPSIIGFLNPTGVFDHDD